MTNVFVNQPSKLAKLVSPGNDPALHAASLVHKFAVCVMLVSSDVMFLIAQCSRNGPFTAWPEQALQGTYNAA